MSEHKDAPLGQRHAPHNYSYVDATARLAAGGFVLADVGKHALQGTGPAFTEWMLTGYNPITWQQVGAQGLSAYQVAVANGYTGTITQWLASLKGDTGAQGAAGVRGTISSLISAAQAALASNAEDLGDMAVPPTISVSGAATSALSVIKSWNLNPELFHVTGGTPAQHALNALATVVPATYMGNSSGTLAAFYGDGKWSQLGSRFTFATDADVLEIRTTRPSSATSMLRILVDGQFIHAAGEDIYTASSGAYAYTKLTFANRKDRVIGVECCHNNRLFCSVAVGPTSNIWRPTMRDTLTVLTGGDSHTEGENVGGSMYSNAWPWKFANMMGIPNVFNVAIGATGYINTSGGTRLKMADQIVNWPLCNPDLIIIANGYNDQGQTSTLIDTELKACMAAIRAKYPRAFIVLAGVFGSRTGPSATVLNVEAAVLASFNGIADPFSAYIPVSADVAPWQFGTGSVSAPTGNGNADFYVSSDGTHPPLAGQDHFARRMAQGVRRILYNWTGLDKAKT